MPNDPQQYKNVSLDPALNSSKENSELWTRSGTLPALLQIVKSRPLTVEESARLRDFSEAEIKDAVWEDIPPLKILETIDMDSGTRERINKEAFIDSLLHTLTLKISIPQKPKDTPIIWWYHPLTGRYYSDGSSRVKFLLKRSLRAVGKPFTLALWTEVRFSLMGDPRPAAEPSEPETYYLLKNRVLDMSDPYTPKILEHTPELFFNRSLNVAYDPDATCPNIDAFIQETFETKEEIRTFFEWVGYCFTPGQLLKKELFIEGPTNTGKSVIMNLLLSFFGAEVVAQRSLKQMTFEKFNASFLKGKLVNLGRDIPKDTFLRIDKTGAGDQYMDMEVKFGGVENIRNDVKRIYTCNERPDIRDDTQATWIRYMVLETPKSVPFEKQDPELLSTLTTPAELSGLLNKALSHIRETLKKNRFSADRGWEATRNAWLYKTNDILKFISEYCDVGRDYLADKDILFEEWVDYPKATRSRRRDYFETKSTFFKEIARLLPEINVSYRPRLDNPELKRCVKGLRLKPDMDSEYKETDKDGQYNKQSILRELSASSDPTPLDELLYRLSEGASESGMDSEAFNEVEKNVKELRKEGRIFEPRPGEWKLLD